MLFVFRRNLHALILLAGAGLVTTACTADSSPSQPAASLAMDSMDEHADFDFGEPADAADADRVIEIVANDQFRYDPESVEVSAGETVTFKVTNEGVIVHEFVLGDEHLQEEHEAEMVEMSPGMAMHDEPNAIAVDPGETKEIAWTFTTAGDLLYGCHERGHYDAGMVGSITVAE